MAHKTHRTKNGLTVWIRARRLDDGTYQLDDAAVKRTALPSAVADLLDADATASIAVRSDASATSAKPTPRKGATAKKSA